MPELTHVEGVLVSGAIHRGRCPPETNTPPTHPARKGPSVRPVLVSHPAPHTPPGVAEGNGTRLGRRGLRGATACRSGEQAHPACRPDEVSIPAIRSINQPDPTPATPQLDSPTKTDVA